MTDLAAFYNNYIFIPNILLYLTFEIWIFQPLYHKNAVCTT